MSREKRKDQEKYFSRRYFCQSFNDWTGGKAKGERRAVDINSGKSGRNRARLGA